MCTTVFTVSKTDSEEVNWDTLAFVAVPSAQESLLKTLIEIKA